MAKKKISELPAGGALNGTELVPIVQTGTTKRITAQDIANLGNASGVEGSGTINRLAKFTATSTIGNSQLFDDGTSVGLGTITPLGLLHLFKASAATRMVIDGNAGQNKIITYRTNAVQRFGLYVNNTAESGANAGSDFAIRAYSDAGTLLSTPLFIKRSTGNVGIGGASNYSKFEVIGATNAKRLGIGTNVYLTNSMDILALSDIGADIPLGISGETIGLYTGATERMRITSTGNVGIGTTTPLLPLQVSSGAGSFVMQLTNGNFVSSSTGSRLLFGFGAATGNTYADIRANSDGGLTSVPLVLQASGGNVGIGTTTPSDKLSISGATGYTGISIDTGNAIGGAYLAIKQNGVSSGFFGGSGAALGDTSSDLALYAETSKGIRFYTNGSASERMRIFTDGNIAINSASNAGYKLDVNGTARVSSDATINSVKVGRGTGNISTNTTIGNTALNANTTGDFNSTIGFESLKNNTTGSSNSALGAYSLISNTTGSNNTGLGFQSGYSITTGANNTVIGKDSLSANSTGSDNSALGVNTQSGNFSGSVILGKDAVATAANQFVVGSAGVNAGSVTTEVNASSKVWNVVINGVAYKILLA